MFLKEKLRYEHECALHVRELEQTISQLREEKLGILSRLESQEQK